ncbi:DeoR/GlpR family DNA-binding transcription regulator [Salinisphaera sp.]|uniref:DeoR/GlpR family DNA-binding transcription regulator n=1 Tax=Salinisphaera sp. TaxID=1914330 RepID=UPI002D7801E5|nr:DeoR/GlpR family DNA-binding transcription regulator [Salinisphaera sp.]HET7315048.1 DeoR/GlpR family DNA-binding transcription regulator [Salinisphaera sp.]
MLKVERHRVLIERLARDGRIGSAELARELAVSEDSIRRDLRELSARGALQRIHGGAVPRPPVPAAYAARLESGQPGKAAIAAAAGGLIRDGQLVFMDGGTTLLAVAERLPRDLRATIVTHAPPIAGALIEHPGIEVWLAGGRIDRQLAVSTGAEAVDFLRGFRADLALLGVCAVHSRIGLTLPSPDERAAKRAMIEQAGEVIALAGAEKIETSFACVLAPIGALNRLVTDARLRSTQRSAYRAAGVSIMQV